MFITLTQQFSNQTAIVNVTTIARILPHPQSGSVIVLTAGNGEPLYVNESANEITRLMQSADAKREVGE